MRRINILLAVSASVLAVSCASKSDIKDLQSQLDELKTGKIATIEQQISSIQSSVITLQATDTQLAAFISTLQLETSNLKTEFSIMEKSLSDKIDNLKKYSDEELGKTKDWISATFATLEQYQAVLGELAAIKESIQSLDEDLRKEIEDSIKASEASMKGWVNEQLAGYYTIAQMDAKLKALQDADDVNADAISKVAGNLESAKAELTEAYTKAINDAITKYNGEITAKIAADIKTATLVLRRQIDALKIRISHLEMMAQSVIIIPDCPDGSVNMVDYNLQVNVIVSPANAIPELYFELLVRLKGEIQSKIIKPTVIARDSNTGVVTLQSDYDNVFLYPCSIAVRVSSNSYPARTDLLSEFIPVTTTFSPFDPRTLPGKYKLNDYKVLGGSGGYPAFVGIMQKNWCWDDTVWQLRNMQLSIGVDIIESTVVHGTTDLTCGANNSWWNCIWVRSGIYCNTDLSSLYDRFPKGVMEYSYNRESGIIIFANGVQGRLLTCGQPNFGGNNAILNILPNQIGIQFDIKEPNPNETEYIYQDVDRYVISPILYVMVFDKQQ